MSAPSQTVDGMSSVRAGTVADEVNGVRTKNLSKRDVEMVRLIGQYLCDKGYNRAYTELAEDSGIVLEHQSATDLRNAILEGRWKDTEVAVNALAESIGNASILQHIRFLLLEQQYLELLEEEDPVSALMLLRSHITPLKPDQKRIYNLTECLMCENKDDLYRQAGGWDGKDGNSRAHLVESIQRFMPAQTMLPPSRLETIVAESVRSQLSSCLFHLEPVAWNSPLDDVSILQPHGCSIMDFPVFPIQKIEHSESELYFSIFSPDGNYLAVAGKGNHVDIFSVNKENNTVTNLRHLSTGGNVSHICWSPDSKKIAVCSGSRPGPITVFNAENAEKICQKQEKADDVYITAAFFGDSRKLAFGGLKGGCFYIIDTEDEGRVLFSHDYCRVQCMVAIVPPPSSFGIPIPAPVDMDPNTSKGLTTSNSNNNTNTPSFDHPGLVHTLDQLLIVDHMYRIRLFRFGYTFPASSSGDGGAVSTNVTAMEQVAAADATSAAAMTTGMWTTAAASSQGGGGSVTPIIMALQTALFPHQQHHRAHLRAGGLLPPPIRQSTSDSSFGMGTGFGSARFQPPAIIPSDASASTPGSLIVQYQPNSSFTLHHIVSSGGSNAPGSVPNLMAAQIGAPGYSLESLSTFPTLVSSLPGLMHQYYMRYAGMPSSTAAGPRASTIAGAPGTSSVRTGGPFIPQQQQPIQNAQAVPPNPQQQQPVQHAQAVPPKSPVMAGLAEGSAGSADSDTAEVSTNTEGSNVGATQTPPGGPPSPSTQGQGYSLIQQVTLIKEIHPIQSIVLSPSCKRLLVALNGKGLVLWDLETQGIIQRFCGYHQVSQKLSYSFCGANEDFICCGSENGVVHIWRVGMPRNCRPIHSMMSASNNEVHVTGVHWNPTHPHMIASANDEGDIHIWAPAKFSNPL